MTLSSPARARTDDLLDTVAELFPGAAIDIGRPRRGEDALRLVPGRHRPKMLVPADAPGAAAQALDRASANDGRTKAVGRRVLAELVARPLLSRLAMPHCVRIGPGEQSISGYLSAVCGAPVRVSLTIGRPRANRKPVLGVYSSEGREVGFAKVGLTPLAGALIDHEATVLRELSARRPQSFVAPRVLHHGRWRGFSVLLLEPLRATRPSAGAGLPVRAVTEIVTQAGVTWQPWEDGGWLTALRSQASRISGTEGSLLSRLVERTAEQHRGTAVPCGTWHGDLGPWNMAWDGSMPLIWDWERSGTGVPAGVDAVHFTAHAVLREVGHTQRARAVLDGPGRAAVRAVLDRLVPPGVPDLSLPVTHAYLLLLAARFLTDAQGRDGSAVTELAHWYAAVLEDQLASNREGQRPWN